MGRINSKVGSLIARRTPRHAEDAPAAGALRLGGESPAPLAGLIETVEGDLADIHSLLNELGQRWVIDDIVFKPYACGTMTQPFIDCAIALAGQGVSADDIVSIQCDVGEGTVHRLWEPLNVKHNPKTPYAAKFSTPICMALGFLEGKAGLSQFTEESIHDPRVRGLAAKVSYVINPDDPYPDQFIGHLRATLKNGDVREVKQGYMRGGKKAPMSIADLETKFVDNAIYGGWQAKDADVARGVVTGLFETSGPTRLRDLRH